MAEFGEPLSERELAVLQLVMQGAANKNIAQDLAISPNTVKVHLRNIYTKLGVATRTEASMAALERGLFSLQGDGTQPLLVVPEGEHGEGEDEADEAEEDTAVAEPILPPPPANPTPAQEVPDPDPQPEPSATPPPVAAEAAAPPQAEPIPSTPQPLPRWVMLGVGLLGLVLVVPLLWWGMGWGNTAEPTAAPLPTAVPENQLISENWFRTQPLPAPRAHAAVASVGLDVYLIGGTDGETVRGDVFIYQTSNRVWRTAAPKPTAVQQATAAQLLGIYVIGGLQANGQPTDAVELYSPAEDVWRQMARLPQPRAGGVAFSTGQAIYYVGGWDGERYTAEAYSYDPASNAWSALPPLPEPRAYATGGVVAGALYLFGGENETGVLPSCLVYQPEVRLWGDCPAMSVARRGASTAVVLGKLYVLGGTHPTTYGELYDPQKEEWQIINIPTPITAESNEQERIGGQGAVLVTVEARLYWLGGENVEGMASAANLIYAPPVYQTFLPAALGGQDQR